MFKVSDKSEMAMNSLDGLTWNYPELILADKELDAENVSN